ncbi:MAG: NAD-binding protein, partial [Thermoguttaceae bacterium]
MRIVVLGAGTVGGSIASLLCLHRHSVTIVDSNADKIRRINETLDVRCITGSASQSSILFQAGVSSADLCLAVTGDDEVNIVSASMSKAMGARRAVSRVYAPVFRDLSTFDYQRHFGIDRLLSLEHLTA